MSASQQQQQQQQQEQYEAWLTSKSVSVRSDLLEMTQQNVVAGWGCVALRGIKKGTVLFTIPRSACFAAADDGAKTEDGEDENGSDISADPTTRDTQKALAVRYLRHRHSSEWSPFLNILTPQSLPWTYAPHLLPTLEGTELDLVVENKLLRLGEEYKSIQLAWDEEKEGECFTWQEYLDATSIVASHANPWFGVSIVPFNTTLNWGKPNVEFEEVDSDEDGGEAIVGRAMADIPKGSELCQAYGESVSELFYRCGFAPVFPEGEGRDSISLFVADIVRIVERLDKSKNGAVSTKADDSSKTNSGMPTSSTISNLTSRIKALKKSGAIDTSSWDGMEDYLTAELCRPSAEFIANQSNGKKATVSGKKRRRDDSAGYVEDLDDEERKSYDDGGVSKLIGICLVLAADEASWKRASLALDNMPDTDHEAESNDGSYNDEESDAESRTDDITASIILSSLANLTLGQSRKLQQCALDIGMGGHDPWRALLIELSSVKTLEWEVALDAAKLVILEKRNRLVKGGEVCEELAGKYPAEKEAFFSVDVLRGVEKSLLSKALDTLNIPFR